MADEKGEANLLPSGAATPKGKLESLSKEDLVKFVKRQTILLQKLKTRNTELESQVSGTENDKSSEISNKDTEDGGQKHADIVKLQAQLSELQQERDEAVEAYNSFQTSQEKAAEQIKNLEGQCQILIEEKEAVFDKYVTFEKKNKNLLEEIECLNLKNETLTSTFQYLQQEQVTLTENNKKLIAEKSDLQIKLEDLEEESFSWKDEKNLLVAQLARHSSSLEGDEQLKRENQELKTKLEIVAKEKDEIQIKLDSLEFKCEQRSEQVELLQSEIGRLQNLERQESDLQARLKEAEQRLHKYEADSANQSLENEQYQEKITTLLKEIDEIKNKSQEMQMEFERQQNKMLGEIEKLNQETEQLKCSCDNVKSELETVISEKRELQRKNEEMEHEVAKFKVHLDTEREILTGNVSPCQNEVGDSEKSATELQTNTSSEISQLETELKTGNEEKEKLIEKILQLERNEEENRKDGSTILAEKLSEIDKLTRDLEVANAKLLDYEVSLGNEFSLEVIQNLQQELAETKMKLSELEGSSEMYASEEQGAEEESGNLQQAGWLDLPDIQEESESDQMQQEQVPQVDHDGLAKEDVEEASQHEPDGPVCVERIEKFIAVSSHVLAEDSYDRGDASDVLSLKARVTELEREKEELKLKFEQLLEKNLEKIDEKGNNDTEMDEHSEVVVSLQAYRQHLEEKLVILGDKHETVTFELEELHAERESMKSEMESLQNQLREWENMMGMLKEEKDCLAHELEDYTNKDVSLRKELEFLLSSLNDAITERDTLKDEVFMLSQHEDSAQGDVKEMKSMIDDIIAERNRLLSELDIVLTAKADATITIEGLKREMQNLQIEKDDIEREKESLLVRFHLAEDKETSMSESYETQRKLSSAIEETFQGLKQQTMEYEAEIVSLKQALDAASERVKAAEELSAERKSYSTDLENQVLELSNLLSDSKNNLSSLKEQIDVFKAEKDTAISEHSTQISDLQASQIANLHASQIANLQASQLTDLHASKIADLPASQLTDLQASQIAELQTSQIADPQTSQIADLQASQLADLQASQIAELQTSQIANLQNQQTEYEQSIKQLTSDVSKLAEEKDELSQNAAMAIQEVEDLNKKLSALVNEKAELDKLMINLKAKNESIEEQMLSRQEEYEMLSSDKHAIEQRLKLCQEHVQELEHKQTSLEEELQMKADEVTSLKDLVQQLRDKDAELQSVLAEREWQLEGADEEKESLAVNMKKLRASMKTLEEEKKDIESQGKDWMLKLEALQSLTEDRLSECEGFQMKVDALEHDLLLLKKNSDSMENSNSDLLQLQQKLEEILHVKEDIEKATSEMKNPEEAPMEHEGSLEIIIIQWNKIFRKLLKEISRCDALEKILVELKLSFQQKSLVAAAEDDVAAVIREKDNISESLKEEQNKTLDLKGQLLQKMDEIHELKTEITTGKQENNNLVCELEEMRANLASAVTAASANEEKIKEFEIKITQLESCLLEKQAEINKCREEINSLVASTESHISATEEIEKSKLDLEKCLQDITTDKETVICQLGHAEKLIIQLQEQAESLGLELNETRKEKDGLIIQVDNLKMEKDAFLNQSMNNNDEVNDLKEKLAKSVETADSLAVQLEEIRIERNELRSRIQHSEKDVETLKYNLDLANEEKEASSNNLDSSMQDIEKLNAELAVIASEKEHLTSELHISEEQVGILRRQLLELKESLKDSKSQSDDLMTRHTAAEVESGKREEEHTQKSAEENAEIGSLRKQLKEKEDINAKLKQLAIKTKKELGEKQAKLDEATKQLNQMTKIKDALELTNETLRKQSDDSSDSLSLQLKNLKENYKKVQDSLDAVQDEAEQEKRALKTAQKDIEQLVTQLTEVRGQAVTYREEKDQSLRQIDLLRVELKNKESSAEELRTKLRATDAEMAAVRIQMEEFNKDRQKVEQRLSESDTRLKVAEDEHRGQILRLEASLRDAQELLTAARQSAKQNSMLDLEMADYERTISTLHAQVAERDQKIEDIKAEVDKQEQTISCLKVQIDAVEEQRGQADSRANKLKAMLVKTKKELSDARELETAQRSSDAHLRGKLENTSQQLEEFKVQVSQLMADNLKLQDKIRSHSDSSQRTVRSLETKVESLTSDLQMARSELKAVQADYDSYKVRAHNVLRQQKSKASLDESTDVEKYEKERYENAIDHLKVKLQEAQDHLQAARKDTELLQEEHEHLIQRHTKLISDLEEREANFRLRLENAVKEKTEVLTELQEKIASLETQKSFQSQKFQEQIHKLKDENAEVVEVHQKQLDTSEMDNIRLQREIQQLQRLLRSREESIEHTSPSEFYPITVHPAEERQEGEGSEIVDTEPIKVAKSQSAPTFTFEQLIATPLDELPGVKSVSPNVDEEGLRSTIAASQKKIEHLTELLSESEEAVSRLTEQARLLKEEIRRLERNMEREKETQNMEYLKNIFLQFVCPKVGEQRQQLVPVLTTMLKLSPEEKARVQSVAQGDEQGAQQGGQGLGWGSYLHRWSSLT